MKSIKTKNGGVYLSKSDREYTLQPFLEEYHQASITAKMNISQINELIGALETMKRVAHY